jgi:hypothetical protein
MPMRCRVYVDFDGTIAPDDPTDALFARFADPSDHCCVAMAADAP